MLQGIKSAHDKVTALSFILSGVALALITLSYIYQVVARFGFNSPSSWSGDLVSYLLVAMVFLGFPKITQEKRHIAVSFLTEKMSPTMATQVGRAGNILAVLACVSAAWFSTQENIYQFIHNISTMGNHPIPKWWLSVIISYSFFSAGLYFLYSVFAPHDDTELPETKQADTEMAGTEPDDPDPVGVE